jgi:hypothetical protein
MLPDEPCSPPCCEILLLRTDVEFFDLRFHGKHTMVSSLPDQKYAVLCILLSLRFKIWICHHMTSSGGVSKKLYSWQMSASSVADIYSLVLLGESPFSNV